MTVKSIRSINLKTYARVVFDFCKTSYIDVCLENLFHLHSAGRSGLVVSYRRATPLVKRPLFLAQEL